MITQIRRILDIPNQILNIQTNVAKIWNQLYEYSPKKESPPFISIIIQAVKVIKDDDGFKVITKTPVTLALSGYAPHFFSFQPDIPIANLQIAIFCDVSKVVIRQIIVANQHICPAQEAAPLAYCELIVEPCNRISIDVALR